jgi:Ala-tRNA(Pro) deacylase
MALTERVREFLDAARIPYEILPHREAFTAQGVAAASHVSGWQLAKVLVVRKDHEGHLMVVIPASCRLDLAALSRVTGERELALAEEDEIGELFPDCEVGAMPPFGNLYGLPVYVDGCVPKVQEVVFQAGNHREVVRMRYPAYEEAVKPTVVEVCRH